VQSFIRSAPDTLILWTIQAPAAWAKLRKDGVLLARRRNLTEESWTDAYEWMMSRMEERIGAPPESDCIPLWAWARWGGMKRRRPDLRAAGHLSKGEEGVRIEFQQAADSVVLSDFGLWHFVLNYWYLPHSEEDEIVFEAKLNSRGLSFFHDKPLPDADLHSEMTDSWERIFDLEWFHPEITNVPEERSVQATMWELRWDQVRRYKWFKSK